MKKPRTETKKYSRMLEFIGWLYEHRHSGLSLAAIFSEFNYHDRTLKRDREEIERIFPDIEINIDRDKKRVFADFSRVKHPLIQFAANRVSGELDQKINIFQEQYRKNLPADALIIKLKECAGAGNNEILAGIISAIVKKTPVACAYNGPGIRVFIPLFLFYASENWYVCGMTGDHQAQTHRLDKITSVTECADDFCIPSAADYARIRGLAVENVRKRQNVFADLTGENTFTADLRFYIAPDYLKKEITSFPERYELLPDGSVRFSLEFSCYYEAWIFLNKWLGHFTIEGPADFKADYIGELKRALKIVSSAVSVESSAEAESSEPKVPSGKG
ncbi:MAG: hypothetical protein A2096_09450 [Spirochaetes bacterium GWF1_41_5]|nr:MAG: hypothetical protein A2096_09450 [Spirochaetes bacterium GWF1_41_5]HBE03664.1 hypothetical protein [Spirochaetia bacterium]